MRDGSAKPGPARDSGCPRYQHRGFHHAAIGRLTEPVLAEYEEVLGRPRLGIHPDKAMNALSRIRAAALLVDPTTTVTAALDPDDNIFLECGQAAQVDYLVTGNTRDFPETFANTRVVTPREFLEVIAGTRREDLPR